jgi:hypothetical protein
MIWLLDAVSFVAWICLSAPFMVTKHEPELIERPARREGLREIIAFLGLLPIVGYLLALHRWWYALLFLLIVNGIAFTRRFAIDALPTWALAVLALVAVGGPGLGYLWMDQQP